MPEQFYKIVFIREYGEGEQGISKYIESIF